MNSHLEHLCSCIYEYLMRVTSAYDAELAQVSNLLLKNADTVDIIDYIETRQRSETANRISSELIQLIAWVRHME